MQGFIVDDSPFIFGKDYLIKVSDMALLNGFLGKQSKQSIQSMGIAINLVNIFQISM